MASSFPAEMELRCLLEGTHILWVSLSPLPYVLSSFWSISSEDCIITKFPVPRPGYLLGVFMFWFSFFKAFWMQVLLSGILIIFFMSWLLSQITENQKMFLGFDIISCCYYNMHLSGTIFQIILLNFQESNFCQRSVFNAHEGWWFLIL